MSDFSFSTALRQIWQSTPFAVNDRPQADIKLIVGQTPDPAWQFKPERAFDQVKAMKARAYRSVLLRNMIGGAV